MSVVLSSQCDLPKHSPIHSTLSIRTYSKFVLDKLYPRLPNFLNDKIQTWNQTWSSSSWIVLLPLAVLFPVINPHILASGITNLPAIAQMCLFFHAPVPSVMLFPPPRMSFQSLPPTFTWLTSMHPAITAQGFPCLVCMSWQFLHLTHHSDFILVCVIVKSLPINFLKIRSLASSFLIPQT